MTAILLFWKIWHVSMDLSTKLRYYPPATIVNSYIERNSVNTVTGEKDVITFACRLILKTFTKRNIELK